MNCHDWKYLSIVVYTHDKPTHRKWECTRCESQVSCKTNCSPSADDMLIIGLDQVALSCDEIVARRVMQS